MPDNKLTEAEINVKANEEAEYNAYLESKANEEAEYNAYLESLVKEVE